MEQKRIKVGLFNDTYFPKIDGVVVVVDNYAKVLNKTNDVFVACPGKGEDYDYNKLGYKVHRSLQFAPKRWAYALPLPAIDKEFKKTVLEERPDIVHIHSPFGVGKQGVKLAKKLNIPVVATIHSQFDQDFYKATKSKMLTKLLTKKIMKVYNACDEVFVMNEKLKELLYSYGYKGKTRLIENATDMSYPKDPEKMLKEANERFSLNESVPVLLFVGRLIEGKGILFIADALKRLKEQNALFKMMFVGSGPDEENLKEKIEQYGLKNEVIFTGKIVDRQILASIYLRADLFLFPSKYDTDGLVRREAGAHKTPSLLANGTMAGSLIVDNDTGFLADYNVETYAKRIVDILNNKELLNKVGENAYEKDYINWEKAVGNAMLAYLELIEKYKNK